MRALHLSYTSRDQVEVYRFSWLVSVGLPLLLVALQAYLPVRMPFLRGFDFGFVCERKFAAAQHRLELEFVNFMVAAH